MLGLYVNNGISLGMGFPFLASLSANHKCDNIKFLSDTVNGNTECQSSRGRCSSAASIIPHTDSHSLKPFWPLLVTFLLPRAFGYARAIQVAFRTRPQPRPLPPQVVNSINVLFASVCVFLYSSVKGKGNGLDNIFQTTNSRLHIPTDVLFARLAVSRPNGLSSIDEALRTNITTPALRSTYLRFGPSTLLDCPFCIPEDDFSYFLYHVPSTVIVPHLSHLLVLGLATSTAVGGAAVSGWRTWSLIGATALLGFDIYVAALFEPTIDVNMPSPPGIYWLAALLRPLSLCAYDVMIAACIWASATGRFIMFSPPNEVLDPVTMQRKTHELLTASNVALQMTQNKLRATQIARNAVVRNSTLKEADDVYWRDVVAMEGLEGGQEIWEDEEVQAAMARAYGSGTLDVTKMRREAEGFVRNATSILDTSQ